MEAKGIRSCLISSVFELIIDKLAESITVIPHNPVSKWKTSQPCEFSGGERCLLMADCCWDGSTWACQLLLLRKWGCTFCRGGLRGTCPHSRAPWVHSWLISPVRGWFMSLRRHGYKLLRTPFLYFPYTSHRTYLSSISPCFVIPLILKLVTDLKCFQRLKRNSSHQRSCGLCLISCYQMKTAFPSTPDSHQWMAFCFSRFLLYPPE